MTIALLDTKNQTFQEIMGNGSKYQVPPFQRDYSWGMDQWEDLWADINSLFGGEDQHYMGYVVLQSSPNKVFKIIDGQQRLTTVSLMILAALKCFQELIDKNIDADNNKKRIDVFRNTYIGVIDPISLQTENKLTLNRNNKSTFKSLSSNLRIIPERGIKRTNKGLNDAFVFFYDKLKSFEGIELAKFIESVTSKLLFTKITVNDDLNAYRVFETLNARGVQLSTPDLLKNYLFSLINSSADVSETELEELDEKWEEIVEQLGKEDFSKFLKTDWNTKNTNTTKSDLFKSIRKKVLDRASAYKYLNELRESAPIFAALSNPYDDFWLQSDYRSVSEHLVCLNTYNVTQPFSIFLAAFNRFAPDEFCKLAKYIEILSLRYNVICNNQANEQERVYNTIAQKIFSGDYSRASHVKHDENFRRLYPDDNSFIQAFRFKTMPSRQTEKKIKYLLQGIENALGSTKIEKDQATLEHILPYNPTAQWKIDFGGDDWSGCIDRIGNIILLSKGENKAAARMTFLDKRKIYADSHYKIAQKVGEYESWNKTNLNDFQHWMSIEASKIWKIDYQNSSSDSL